MARLDWDKARRRDRATPGPNHNVVRAQWAGTCPWCQNRTEPGDLIAFNNVFWGHHDCIHPECREHAPRVPKNSVTSRNALGRYKRATAAGSDNRKVNRT